MLQLKDEAFEETEKIFRMQERLIKSFIRDLSLYLQHVRVSWGGSELPAPSGTRLGSVPFPWADQALRGGLPSLQDRGPDPGVPFPGRGRGAQRVSQAVLGSGTAWPAAVRVLALTCPCPGRSRPA